MKTTKPANAVQATSAQQPPRSTKTARLLRNKLTREQLARVDEEIEELPRDRLLELAGRALRALDAEAGKRVLGSVGIEVDGRDAPGEDGLLRDVEAFCRESYAGDHYDSFDVNSRNFMELSEGTRDWTRKCERLGARCLASAAKKVTSAGAKACGLLVQLLHHIDQGHDDVVFWADEGGTWQVDVDTDRLRRAWFQGLAKMASDTEYVEAAKVAIGMVGDRDRAAMERVVRRVASASQRRVLTSSGILPASPARPVVKRSNATERSARELEARVRKAMRR